MPLDFNYWHVLLTSCAAYVFSVVLVQPGMLLQPLKAKWENWYAIRYQVPAGEYFIRPDLNEQYWFKPIWGCAYCVAGWWSLVAYLFHCEAYHWHEHLYAVTLGILLIAPLSKLYRFCTT